MFKNIGATWILNALQILVLMKLTPFVLEALGKGQNGVWVTIVSFTGIQSLLILGVPMASVRFISEHVARKDVERTNQAIATCLGICIALGACALLLGGALYFFFDAKYLQGPQGAALPAAAIQGARVAFFVVVAQVAMGFALRLPYGIFDAHHDFVVRNLIMAGELILRFGLTLCLLSWRAELAMLAVVQVGCTLFEFALMMVIIRRRYPRVRFSLAGFDRRLVRSILGFSVFAMLLNVGSLLAFRSDAMVIGAHLPAEEATNFDMGNKFFDPMMQLLIAVGAVVMPMATKLKATGDASELRHVFLKWSKICLSIVLMIGLYLLVLGPEFLGAWVGEAYVVPSGRVLQVLMLSFFFYLPVRGVALPVLMGLGKPEWPAIALLVMGFVNLALSLLLVGPMGILGVAIGTAIPNVLFAAAVVVPACREVGVKLREYLGYVALRPLIGSIVPLVLLLGVKHALQLTGFVPLISSGIAMVAVFAIVWVLFVYRDDPYIDLRVQLARAIPGAWRRKTP